MLWQKEGGEETLVIDEVTKRKYEEAKSMEERAKICKQQLERDKNKSEQERGDSLNTSLEQLKSFRS